jgi:hypothetical protein
LVVGNKIDIIPHLNEKEIIEGKKNLIIFKNLFWQKIK